jgi:hypothetical protein
LAFFAAVHGANVDELPREISAELESPSAQPYVYKETLQDTSIGASSRLVWQPY